LGLVRVKGYPENIIRPPWLHSGIEIPHTLHLNWAGKIVVFFRKTKFGQLGYI
jgi:hypothetical protein